MEKTAALLVIPTESKAKGSKATWSPAHKIRDYKGSLMPWQRGVWVSGKTWLPAHFYLPRREEDTAARIPWEIQTWGLVLEGEGPGLQQRTGMLGSLFQFQGKRKV